MITAADARTISNGEPRPENEFDFSVLNENIMNACRNGLDHIIVDARAKFSDRLSLSKLGYIVSVSTEYQDGHKYSYTKISW